MNHRSLLESLPQELFFEVVSYLGPTKDLLSLSQVSKQIHGWTKIVGDSVVLRAIEAQNFRGFLIVERSVQNESNLCVIVRHADYVVMTRTVMKHLQVLLDQHRRWDLSDTDERRLESHEVCVNKRKRRSTDLPRKRTRHTQEDLCVDAPLSFLSLCLRLSCPSFISKFDGNFYSGINFSELDRFLQQSCPRAVEKVFLYLCGKLCAKVYQTVKSRAERRFQTCHESVTDAFLSHAVGAPRQHVFVHDTKDPSLAQLLDELRLVQLRRLLHHIFIRVVELPKFFATVTI